MKLIVPIVVTALLLGSCGSTQQQATNSKPQLNANEQAFLVNLSSLCGKSFEGRETYTKDGRDSWVHKRMVIHFTVCDSASVHIPFHVNENQSRTWIFLNENGRLRFRHDHRHEDGTPEDITLYGGYADSKGTTTAQSFPADDYTTELINDELDRVWNIILSEDLSSMTYELGYIGEIVFRAEFDLSKPL